MYLDIFELRNFRNYEEAQVQFSRDKNVLFGENAQGKTNLLEAIFSLCLTKSFRTPFDGELISFSEDSFSITGKFVLSGGFTKVVNLKFSRESGKSIRIDKKRISRHSELVGQLPIVLLSPEDYRITMGAPSERRRFVDILFSQISTKYLNDLQEYRRILKQRNKILQEGKDLDCRTLEPWNHNLVQYGCEIIAARRRFRGEFSPILEETYRKLGSNHERVSLRYIPSVSVEKNQGLESCFHSQLLKLRNIERIRGITLVGPHRDDFRLEINGRDLRKFGSRGQHKTSLIALKIAELNFIVEKKEETPILLLDDLYSDLDTIRETKVKDLIEGSGQTFITTTRKDTLERTQESMNEENSYFLVKEGTLTRI